MTRVERDCLRALTSSAMGYDLRVSITLAASRAWCSALFTGRRLTLALTADDDAGLDEWLAVLPDADLPIPGHFAASAEVVARNDRAASIELLVVAEG